MAMARSSWNDKITIHCYMPPQHGGDHFDRDLNICWRKKAQGLSLGPARRMPWHRRGRVAA
jgi:hypothetical protein